MIRIYYRGLNEIMRANEQIMIALRPSGGFGQVIHWATTEAHRYSQAITHVDTAALKKSQRMEMIKHFRGEIFLDVGARNPRTGQRPAEYGYYEHNRGGTHAFFERTIFEAGPPIAKGAATMLWRFLP